MAIPRIPERFLLHIWQHQLFSSSTLVTSGGARVVVRSPGLMNPDGGPDFTGALIRIGGTLYRGDVELHIRVSSWRAHGHSNDPHYNRVILHCVLLPGGRRPPPRTESGRSVPLLVLSPLVDPRLYGRWALQCRAASASPAQCRVMKCALPVLSRKIRALGRRRIESRVRSLGKRLRALVEESEAVQGGSCVRAGSLRTGPWEQLLYECLLEGMGYSRNRSSFLALARSVPLPLVKAHGFGDTKTLQALLFGAAGLLPPLRALRDDESRAYVRTLRRRWRALRGRSGFRLLHEGDWMFFRMHPVNFPTARLAIVCFLFPSLFAGHPVDSILELFRSPGATPRARYSALVSMFRVSPEGFWSRHLHFRGRHRGGGIALGRTRVNDLIVNGIVPLLLLYARMARDGVLRRESLAVLPALPPAPENGVTRRVKAALIAGRSGLRSPVEQQGLLHLHNAYCSRGRCIRCPLGAGVRPEKVRPPERAVRSLRMSRRCLPARMSKCSRP